MIRYRAERPGLQDDQLNSIIFTLCCDGLETVSIQTTVAVGDQDDLASVGQLLGDSLYHVNCYDQGRDSCSSQYDEVNHRRCKRTVSHVGVAGHKLLFEPTDIWHQCPT